MFPILKNVQLSGTLWITTTPTKVILINLHWFRTGVFPTEALKMVLLFMDQTMVELRFKKQSLKIFQDILKTFGDSKRFKPIIEISSVNIFGTTDEYWIQQKAWFRKSVISILGNKYIICEKNKIPDKWRKKIVPNSQERWQDILQQFSRNQPISESFWFPSIQHTYANMKQQDEP